MSTANGNNFDGFSRSSLFNIMAQTEIVAQTGGWEWDITEDVWTFSDNWLRIHGVSSRQLKTADLLPIAHPDDIEDIEKALATAANEGLDYEIEHRIINSESGEVRCLHSIGMPTLDSDGKVVKLFGSAQDITDQKRAEAELRRTKLLLESSIESPDDVIILSLDCEYRYLYFNRAHIQSMREVYGADPQVGDCIFDHMKDKTDIETVKAHYDRALAGEGHVDNNVYGKGRTQYTFEVRYNPVYNNDGEVIGVSVFASDITERIAAERDLKRNVALLGQAQRVAKLGHWEMHAPATTPTWSDGLFQIFGLDPRNGAPDFEEHKKIIHKEDWDLIQASLEELGANGTPYDLEFRILLPDGEVGWMHAVGSAETDDDGHVERMFGIAQDITTHKQSQQALIKSNRMFARTESIAHIGSWEWDIEPDRVRWSDELYRICGLDPAEGPPRWSEHEKLFATGDFPHVVEAVQGCMERGTPYELELRFLRPDGEIRFCIARGRAQHDEKGEIQQLVGSLQDITEIKQARKDLSSLEKRNSALLDYSPACHQIVDLDFNLQYMSQSGFKMLKIEPDTPVSGKPYPFHFFPDSFRRDMVEDLKKVKLSGEMFVREALACDSEGNEVWLESSLIPVFEDGELEYISVVSTNTTERKQHEQASKRYEDQFKQAQKMEAIGVLAGGIAHDFNNMLGIMIGNISYLLSNTEKENERYGVLDEVLKSSQRAQGLAQQLLTFSGGGAPIKKVVDINEVVKGAAMFASRGIRAKCHFNLSEDLWPCEADEGQLNQVVNNILINANQAMPNGGAITIGTENVNIDQSAESPLPAGRYIKLSFEDDGVGISEKNLPKIFEPYFSTKQDGSGLGLATAYSIVKKHNGHIAVDTKIAKGAVFTICLPATESVAIESERQGETKHRGQGRILVMDDEELVLAMAQRMLEQMGYEVAIAQDGATALELYKEAHAAQDSFAAVILDLTVPGGMGGVATVDELLKIDPEVKAIVSSGYSNDSAMADFAEHGFCGVVPKPYTIAELAEAVKGLLGSQN